MKRSLSQLSNRLRPGQQIGNFTIVSYIGQSTVHPVKAVVLSKDHEWYNCLCSCGTAEVCNRQQLVDKRRIHRCVVCIKKGNQNANQPE